MKVLVTGGTGFTGSHLAETLFNSGHDVRLLVRNPMKVNTSANYDPEIIEGDIRDATAVNAATKGVEKVFHIAAVFRTAGISDSVYRDIHITGTENLLKASLKYNVKRFVHCSTVGVHGHIEEEPANEDYRFKPGDIYQETKLEGELRALAFTKKTGLPVSVIRPCAIYGPGDMRLYKLFKLASQKIVPVLGTGEIFYHMVYIDDLVNAFILASETPNAVGQSFIAGGAERLTLNDLVDIIGEILGQSPVKVHLPAPPFQLLGELCERICIPLGINPPIYRRRVDFFTKSRSFDISKAKEILNYSPKVSVYEGLKNTAEWYKRKGLL